MNTVAIYCYDGMTMLDVIGPYEVFRRFDDFEILFVGQKKGEAVTDIGHVSIKTTHAMKDVKSADILIIPGAQISFIREMEDKKVLRWIQQINATTKRTVALSSGVLILVATGLLTGRKVATHWRVADLLQDDNVFRALERVHDDKDFITAKGSSDGIDVAIYLISELKGEKHAQVAQLAINHNPQPAFNIDQFGEISEEVLEMTDELLKKHAKRTVSKWRLVSNMKMLLKLKVTLN